MFDVNVCQDDRIPNKTQHTCCSKLSSRLLSIAQRRFEGQGRRSHAFLKETEYT
jgi:hypothetical protein